MAYTYFLIYLVWYMLSFATVVELTAIAKSCVEREKSFGKIAQGTNCPYEEIFHNLWKNCNDHHWLVPLAVLSILFIFLKEQAEIPPGLYP